MEGQTKISENLGFAELQRKFRVVQNGCKLAGEKLVAAANDYGLIIVALEDSLKAISLDSLLGSDQLDQSTDELTQFTSSFDLDFRPTLLSVNKATLLVIGTSQSNCPVIEAVNLNSWKSIGKQLVNSCKNHQVIDYAWHPNYPDIVVLCTNQGCLIAIVISEQHGISLIYESQQYGALTCCWSPRGKNLAIGTIQGTVKRLEPQMTNSSFSFKEVDKSTIDFSPRTIITPEHQVLCLRWISRTALLCVLAKPGKEPDTIYTATTVKPSKPFLFWKNLYCETNNLQNHKVYLANLSSSVICTSNLTGEAAVIGAEGEKESTVLGDWQSIVVDEEGARIRLPLDSDNSETYSVGLATAMSPRYPENPILIFLTNDGVLCLYIVLHKDPNLKLPDPQPEMDLPPEITCTILTSVVNYQHNQLNDQRNQLNDLGNRLSDLSNQLHSKENQIAELEAKLEEFSRALPSVAVSDSRPTTIEEESDELEPAAKAKENVEPKASKIEEGDDELNLSFSTPDKAYPRPSIGQWSVVRKRNDMSVRRLIDRMENKR